MASFSGLDHNRDSRVRDQALGKRLPVDGRHQFPRVRGSGIILSLTKSLKTGGDHLTNQHISKAVPAFNINTLSRHDSSPTYACGDGTCSSNTHFVLAVGAPRAGSSRPRETGSGDVSCRTCIGTSKFSGLSIYFVLFAVLFSLATVGESKYVEGHLRTPERWAFLTRFCFLSNQGRFDFDLEYDLQPSSHQKLLLYYDEPHQWDAVYKSNMTCHQREAVMKIEHNQFINLTLYSRNSECEILRPHPGNSSSYHCRGHRSFRSARERWWFIAVSNCESTTGLQLNYRLTMTNGYSFWYKHFSADEFYILRTDLIALILEMGIFFLSVLAAAELRRRHLLHTTYRLYMYAIVLQVLALILLSIHYARYGVNGVGFPLVKLAGRMVASASTIVTVLFVLLMGKGFNITRGRLKQHTAVRLTTFMCLFIVTYGMLFLYEQKFFDPGEVLYLYQSGAGYGIVCLRLIGWAMFLYSCFFTLKYYPEKSKFYLPFMIFYTLWFVAGPIIILISNLVIDKWVREKVVNAVELSVVICGHAFFLFITRPNVANSNFPYHVRTTQIMAMEQSETGKFGNNSLDKFSAHVYAPDLPADGKNYAAADLFIVSGSIQMRPVDSANSTRKHDPLMTIREARRPQDYPPPCAVPSSRLMPIPTLPPLRGNAAHNTTSTVYTVAAPTAPPLPLSDGI